MIFWLKYRGTHFPVHDRECLIGRSPHCAVVLASPRASREHAVIRQVDDGLEILDLGSRNGTLVNGESVNQRCRLSYGDVIEVGGDRLEVSRKAPSTFPPTMDGEVQEPGEVAQRHVLELAEELLLRGAESGEREQTARAIYSMVDALVQSAEQTHCQLSAGEAVRLAAVAQVAARWTGDHSLDDWCRRVELSLSPPVGATARPL